MRWLKYILAAFAIAGVMWLHATMSRAGYTEEQGQNFYSFWYRSGGTLMDDANNNQWVMFYPSGQDTSDGGYKATYDSGKSAWRLATFPSGIYDVWAHADGAATSLHTHMVVIGASIGPQMMDPDSLRNYGFLYCPSTDNTVTIGTAQNVVFATGLTIGEGAATNSNGVNYGLIFDG